MRRAKPPRSRRVATGSCPRSPAHGRVRAAARRRQRAELRKNFTIGAIFIVSTISQVYTGIKCIGFRGAWHTHPSLMSLQGTLMGLSVFLINVEAWLVKRLLNALTKEEGFYVPEFHQHRLFFTVVDGHYCDMCQSRARHMYRCEVCDFDACPACFKKKRPRRGLRKQRAMGGLG